MKYRKGNISVRKKLAESQIPCPFGRFRQLRPPPSLEEAASQLPHTGAVWGYTPAGQHNYTIRTAKTYDEETYTTVQGYRNCLSSRGSGYEKKESKMTNLS